MSITFIFFALIAALFISYFLSKKGYNHIFYFSLCLLLVICSITFGVASNKRKHSIEPSTHQQIESLEWLEGAFIILSIITVLFSIINLFISGNKRSVKIISGIVVGLAITGVLIFIYAITHMGKIGG